MIKWLKCSKTKSSTRLFYFQHDWVIEVFENKVIHPSVLLPTWLSDWSVRKQSHPPVCSTSNMIEWLQWLKCSKTNSSTRLFYFQHDWVIAVLKNKFIHPSVLLPTWLSDWSVKKQIHPPVCSTSNMIEWLKCLKQIHPPVCSTSNMIEWLKCSKTNSSTRLFYFQHDWVIEVFENKFIHFQSTRLFYFQHDWVIEVFENKVIHPSVLLPTWLSDWSVKKQSHPPVCSTSNMIEWLKC